MKSSLWRRFWLLTFLLLCGMAHAGKVTYIYTDPQGTPIAEADEQGNITKTFDYRPYGQQALGDPPNGPGYTGHVNDPDTDLVYMQARYYDPEMGRFLSVDPVGPAPGDVFGFNRYAYAGNNPINRIDPNGRQEEDAEVDVYENIQNARTLRPIIIPSTTLAARSILDPVVLSELQETESYSRSAAEQFENLDRTGNEILRNTAERGGSSKAGELGKAGEAAVRAVHDIGEKESIDVNGRTRIPDGVTPATLSEVKNVGKLSFTQQLRDYKDISQDRGLQFDLYTRPDTQISGPLQYQIDNGFINHVYIP